MSSEPLTGREVVLSELHRERPINTFARRSLLALSLVAIASWIRLLPSLDAVWDDRRRANLSRFLSELRPWPLQGHEWDWATALSWAGGILREKGVGAAIVTIEISVVAIVLAALAGLALSLPATRTLAAANPYVPGAASRGLRHAFFSGVVLVTRLFLVFLRSIPEYVWAFLFIAIFGPSAWPVILALTIHNGGILGKLDAEVVENLPPAPMAALRSLGASRRQIAAFGIFPAAFPRLLLFLFYRWETCLREATVLGMLGVVSLGFWIQDARVRFMVDEMFFLVLLGAGIVILGDLASGVARRLVRV